MLNKDSVKAKAFKLFDEGFDKGSPEVKALGMRPGTRHGYYKRWQDGEGQPGVPQQKESVKPIVELEAAPPEELSREQLPQGQLPRELSEVPQEEGPLPREEGKLPREKGPPRIPTTVAGQGITVTCIISVKTYALFQIAASIQDGDLTMGDFIDACAEDVYRQRGKDLGLIDLRRDDGNHG